MSNVEDVELDGIIPPNQTYLVVGRETGRDTTQLPEHRIKSVDLKRTASLLNPYGFQLTLIAKRGEVAAKQESVDEAGNLKPAPAGSRRDDARAFNDDVAWNLPNGLAKMVIVSLLSVVAGSASSWNGCRCLGTLHVD